MASCCTRCWYVLLHPHRSCDRYQPTRRVSSLQYGFTPFKGSNRDETFANIQKKDGLHFPDHPHVSKTCKNLITKLLHPVAKKRLGSQHGASDIKAHPWFSSIKWACILLFFAAWHRHMAVLSAAVRACACIIGACP